MYNSSINEKLRPIIPPTTCPSCGTELVLIKDQLFCKGNNCPAKSLKKLEHFAKTMKIKGLGEKTLEKLADLDIADIADIYELTPQVLYSVVGEKIAVKLLQEIEKSKTVDLATFIAAFSIPLFGSTAATKLASLNVESIEGVTYENLKSVGIGDKAAQNFLNWVEEEWIPLYNKLPITISKKSPVNPVGALGTVVITGTFEKSRSVLEAELREAGFDPKDSISSKTKFLLLGNSKSVSSKEKKARELNITIVYSLEELLQKVNLE